MKFLLIYLHVSAVIAMMSWLFWGGKGYTLNLIMKSTLSLVSFSAISG